MHTAAVRAATDYCRAATGWTHNRLRRLPAVCPTVQQPYQLQHAYGPPYPRRTLPLLIQRG